MKSRAVESFWEDYRRLPDKIQQLALKQYRIWQKDPRHPSIRFKKIGARYWSARVTDDYRAVGILEGDTVIWFFIGRHAEYNRILKSC